MSALEAWLKQVGVGLQEVSKFKFQEGWKRKELPLFIMLLWSFNQDVLYFSYFLIVFCFVILISRRGLTWSTNLASFSETFLNDPVLSRLWFHKFVSAVSRIEAFSEQYDMFMQLDLHSEAYLIKAGEKFRMVLAPTLNLDGSDVTEYFIPVIYSSCGIHI